MRSIYFVFFTAATLVIALPDDDLTILPDSSEDLSFFDISNDPMYLLVDDDDSFLDLSNIAAYFSSNMDDLAFSELEASCTSGIEQPLFKRGEGICDWNAPRPIGHFIDNVHSFFGIQAKEGAFSMQNEPKCLPSYPVHLCCTTEGPLIFGSALIYEYMGWCQMGM